MNFYNTQLVLEITISRNKAYTHAVKAAAEEVSAHLLKPVDLIHDDKKQFPKQKQ